MVNEILLNIGRLSVFTLSFFLVLAYLWYCFVVYKKGLEFRYTAETLYDLALLSGALGWLFARLGFVIEHFSVFKVNFLRLVLLSEYPGYNYLGLVIGLVLAVTILARREEIKSYEGLDLLGLGLPGAMAFERLGRVFSGEVRLVWQLPLELLQALVFLLIFVWLWRLEKEYRTFSWYRFRRTQARPGFIFGSFLFLSGLVVMLSNSWPLFKLTALLFGFFGLILGTIIVYLRSGRSLIHDVKLLPVIGKWYTRSK